VTKVVAFGAFVEILPGVEGLVHISELADHHVESPTEVVEPNSKLNVKILEIDEERRRLSLSIKQVEGENMPMGDLGAQIEASAEAADDEGSDVATAGPVAEGAPPAHPPEDQPSTPPADEAAEETAEESVAEAPADEAPEAEEFDSSES
jgi:small subunit ribosomal protein S1